MKLHSMEDLFVDQLKDLYSAETQILKALPKMVKAASSEDLRDALEKHRQETEGHVERLERICEQLGVNPKGKKCVGMKGLLEEGSEVLEADGEPAVLDAGMIAAAQRVEHYEMAGYGCAETYAKVLGRQDAVNLLEETLEEEKAADKKLTELAESFINQEAAAAQA